MARRPPAPQSQGPALNQSGVDPHFESAFPDLALLGRDKGPLWAGSPSDFCEEGRPRVIILPGSAVGSSALQAGSPSAAAPSSRWLRKHHRGTPAFVTRAVMSNAVGSSVEVYVLLRKREPVE